MTAYASRAFGGAVQNWAISTVHYTVKISGQPVFVIAGSLNADLSIGRRSQASFQVLTDTTVHFEQYQQVTIFDQNGVLVFRGFITTPKEQTFGFQSALLHTITATDMHWVADKRVVATSYTNKTTGAIALDICNTILAQEGVTIGQVFDGLLPSPALYPNTGLYPNGNVGAIPAVTFAYCTVAQALDQLVTTASSAGIPYYWMIDQNRKFFFVPYDAIINSLPVDGSWIDQKTTPCVVTRQNPKYRNTEWMFGATAQTGTLTKIGVGDGQTSTWTMDFPLAAAPTITVDSVAQTVGIKGQDTGRQFYWAKGDAVIAQDTGATKLTSSNHWSFTYIGQYADIVTSQDKAQVAYQASLDGTTGIVEAVDQDTSLTDAGSALIETNQLLTRYAVQGTQLQFTTMTPGYMPGQLIAVNLPMHNLASKQMLISSVRIADNIDNLNVWYTVTSVLGPYDVTWTDFFSKLLRTQQPVPNISTGVSGGATPIAVTFTATLSPTALLTASAGTVGGGGTGGGTGGGSGKIQLFKFGDNVNSNSSLSSPGIKGTNILLYWTQLETADGVYNWSALDGYISTWGGAGKKIILRVSTCGQSSWNPPYSIQGTPQWVFNLGVRSYKNSGGDVVPQYWNPTFKAKLGAFISAMGARYDGNPNIAYIQCAVGMGGECTPDTRNGDANRLSNLQGMGYTDPVWFQTTKDIMTMYSNAFTRTPLCMIPKGFLGGTAGYNERLLVNYILGLGNFGLQNDGIGDKSGYIQPDPTWTKALFISAEQRNKTSTTGDSLDADIQAMIAYCQTSKPAYGLLFSADIDANPAIISKYA